MQKKLDLLRGVGPFLMGRVVILPQAFPLRLCLCPLGGRGRGCRLVIEVDCGTRKSSVLGDVAPVTGPRRAVTHCDRTCINAQRPTPNAQRPNPLSPHKSSAIQIARHRSSATSSARTGYAPRPTHTTPTDPSLLRLHLQTKSGEPSSIHQPIPRMLLRAMLPASPFQPRLLRG